MKYFFLLSFLFFYSCQKEQNNLPLTEKGRLEFDILWVAPTEFPVARPEKLSISHVEFEFGSQYLRETSQGYLIESLCHYSSNGDTCYIIGTNTSHWMQGDTLVSQSFSHENVSAWGVIKFISKRWKS